VTKFIVANAIFWSHFVVLFKPVFIEKGLQGQVDDHLIMTFMSSTKCDQSVGVEYLSLTSAAQQSVTKMTPLTIMNLVTLNAGAKYENLFNKQASDS